MLICISRTLWPRLHNLLGVRTVGYLSMAYVTLEYAESFLDSVLSGLS